MKAEAISNRKGLDFHLHSYQNYAKRSAPSAEERGCLPVPFHGEAKLNAQTQRLLMFYLFF
jgi:hypothetical protein